MPVTAQQIEQALREAIAPIDTLEVINESHLHAGHAGAGEGSHWRVRLITPQARRRGVEIIHRPGEDVACRAPRNKLVSILWNLIHNAVSVAQSGGHVEVWVEREGESLLFNVRDDGPGMDKATRERASGTAPGR